MKTRKVDVRITEPDGTVVFDKDHVEVPEQWSDRAATIAASKYFAHEEYSVLTVCGRIARQLMMWGLEQEYFDTEEEANEFMNSVEDILLNQRAAFNSPVWFNVGVAENSNQVAACFIYGVEDNMEDILEHVKREGLTFKNGSGAGVNVSKLRAKGEMLSNRGVASGPISFMKIWDQTAGSIKSGGKTRRSAKMVVMNIDHPDVEEFIDCKLLEEKKALILVQNGIDPQEAYDTVAFQNANHSIMVTDQFMNAVYDDLDWNLYNRGDGEINRTIKAKELFNKMARVAYATGDPGIQFRDRINIDNPVPSLGDIDAPNPCTEHVAINNSACNLASMNLVAYLDKDGNFDDEQFKRDVYTMITAQDIMINPADYPTEETRKIAVETRPLGLGFTNLGALLIIQGIPYDSDDARSVAGYITNMMTTAAYNMSSELAKKVGIYKHYEDNKSTNISLVSQLTRNQTTIAKVTAHGLRNSQVTLLAPAGTISFLMDCDTTGIEPLFALKVTKQLAGGGTIDILPKCLLEERDVSVLKTANEIHPRNHILMMAACQQHLNGAISKTVNMPHNCKVADIEDIYMLAWQHKLKSIAVYRDGSKMLQPLTAIKDEEKIEEVEEIEEVTDADEDKWTAFRRKLPETRRSLTHKFNIAGLKGYLTCGTYNSGDLGEIFIRTPKQGTTVDGLMDGLATAVSLGLQYGVPLETFTNKFIGSKFEPAGITTNEDIRLTQSVLDYIFRWLKLNFMDEYDDDDQLISDTPQLLGSTVRTKISFDGPPCPKCQTITERNASCYVCPQCGETTGCS